jgi:predicted dehydrogenase
MKYSNDFCMELVATRAQGPETKDEVLKGLSKNAVITLSDKGLRIDNRQGKKVKQKRFKYEPELAMKQAFEAFALSIIEPQEHPLNCSGREQLKIMAVLEAAYLSARTGMPEQPQRILALDDTEPTLFWPSTK